MYLHCSDSPRAINKVEQYILTAREILGPSPVRLGVVPDWLRRQLMRAYGCKHNEQSGWAVLNHARERDGGWLWCDHWGSTNFNGQTLFAAEPWRITANDLAQIETVAGRLGVDWQLTSLSWWCPGGTFRILFREREGVRL